MDPWNTLVISDKGALQKGSQRHFANSISNCLASTMYIVVGALRFSVSVLEVAFMEFADGMLVIKRLSSESMLFFNFQVLYH